MTRPGPLEIHKIQKDSDSNLSPNRRLKISQKTCPRFFNLRFEGSFEFESSWNLLNLKLLEDEVEHPQSQERWRAE